MEPAWNLSYLKDKEKDIMADIFKQWKDGERKSNIQEHWSERQQKLLGK